MSDQVLTTSIYLRKLGTSRWVDVVIDLARGFIRLLVEVDQSIPSAEFVPFNHISGAYKSANAITYGFLGKSYCTVSFRKVSCCRHWSSHWRSNMSGLENGQAECC